MDDGWLFDQVDAQQQSAAAQHSAGAPQEVQGLRWVQIAQGRAWKEPEAAARARRLQLWILQRTGVVAYKRQHAQRRIVAASPKCRGVQVFDGEIDPPVAGGAIKRIQQQASVL